MLGLVKDRGGGGGWWRLGVKADIDVVSFLSGPMMRESSGGCEEN